MQLKLKLTPRKVTARTQAEVVDRIRDRHLNSFGALGYALTPYPCDRKDHVRVYSLEKRRKKVKRTVTKQGRYTEVISRGHWVGIYYDIPASLLEAARLKVVQGARTFEIKKR